MEKFNNIKVISQNNEGNGICKINNIITFVPYTLPNEIVDIKIEKQKKNYNEGKLISIIKKTNERTKPLCKYYYECGGCNIMHESYEAQLEFKKNKVINNLKHIAIIMDGNRRWAKSHGKLASFGHREGAKTLEKIVRYANNIPNTAAINVL